MYRAPAGRRHRAAPGAHHRTAGSHGRTHVGRPVRAWAIAVVRRIAWTIVTGSVIVVSWTKVVLAGTEIILRRSVAMVGAIVAGFVVAWLVVSGAVVTGFVVAWLVMSGAVVTGFVISGLAMVRAIVAGFVISGLAMVGAVVAGFVVAWLAMVRAIVAVGRLIAHGWTVIVISVAGAHPVALRGARSSTGFELVGVVMSGANVALRRTVALTGPVVSFTSA